MIERNKITISFLPHDDDLWHFIQLKKKACNLSEYIRNLICNDMNNNHTDIDEEKIVEKLLEALQYKDITLPGKKEESIEEIVANEEVKNTINSLF
ncbi:hypothetical protein VBD025_02805 [Virgibacillus flavescens]|uniref:hypothetical protein n=1 Tax=Virgibacillus flavescens TaxID=1611422 RepID=UPI003D3393DC